MTRIALLTVAVLAATGCQSGFFSERGTMASDGPYPNTWKWHPQGCTRDPFDGLPVGQSKSIVTLLWANPGLRDPSLSIPSKSPDAPLRLEFMPAPGRLQEPSSGRCTRSTRVEFFWISQIAASWS